MDTLSVRETIDRECEEAMSETYRLDPDAEPLVDYARDEMTPTQRAVKEALVAWGFSLWPVPASMYRPYRWDGRSFIVHVRVGRVRIPSMLVVGRRDGDPDRIARVWVAYIWERVSAMRFVT